MLRRAPEIVVAPLPVVILALRSQLHSISLSKCFLRVTFCSAFLSHSMGVLGNAAAQVYLILFGFDVGSLLLLL